MNELAAEGTNGEKSVEPLAGRFTGMTFLFQEFCDMQPSHGTIQTGARQNGDREQEVLDRCSA